MKKLLMNTALFFMAVVILSSCGSGKAVREAQETFKGDWILNSVTYPGSTGSFNVTLFNDAKAACFENSLWSFVANNNTGTYAVQSPSCATGIRNFRWNVQEVNAETGNYDFLFKPTDDRNKSESDVGFRINLVTLTEDIMVWEQTVNFEGDSFTIRMQFSKI